MKTATGTLLMFLAPFLNSIGLSLQTTLRELLPETYYGFLPPITEMLYDEESHPDLKNLRKIDRDGPAPFNETSILIRRGHLIIGCKQGNGVLIVPVTPLSGQRNNVYDTYKKRFVQLTPKEMDLLGVYHRISPTDTYNGAAAIDTANSPRAGPSRANREQHTSTRPQEQALRKARVQARLESEVQYPLQLSHDDGERVRANQVAYPERHDQNVKAHLKALDQANLQASLQAHIQYRQPGHSVDANIRSIQIAYRHAYNEAFKNYSKTKRNK